MNGKMQFIAISSFSDPECETEQQQQPTSDSNLPAIIGGAVAGVVYMLTVSPVVRNIR